MSEKKVVVITGVSKGIGFALTQMFLADGHTVIGIGRETPLIENPNFFFYPCDLTSEQDLQQVGKQVAGTHAVTAFVHNAMSTPGHKPFLSYTQADFLQAHSVCSVAPVLLMRRLMAPMRAAGSGRVVFLGSSVQQTGSKGQLCYLMAKSALSGVVKGLALELSSSNITVNQILLGPVETEKLLKNVDLPRRKEIQSRIPLGRFCSLTEIFHWVHFLTSTQSGYMTGADLNLSGGLPLHSA